MKTKYFYLTCGMLKLLFYLVVLSVYLIGRYILIREFVSYDHSDKCHIFGALSGLLVGTGCLKKIKSTKRKWLIVTRYFAVLIYFLIAFCFIFILCSRS